ncbi:kinesin-like protein KIN-10C isoform X2 [Quercus lobata]|uniref:Kinesin motor domain-containing protein n=1 Tax=Quercus lobata TaxID=97700 RepID=A0A7N2M7Z8_QUELO|nr:kinesin-like protein KIN-10C isoform X2 [Quercus lobata]
MASTSSGRPDRTKAFNPTRMVRVVAKIRGFADSESSTALWISVNKPNGEISDSVTISFGDSGSRKESCEVNYCYEQNEGNDLIFSREVKPLIFGVFEGCNSTVIACGARGSGKTFVIQGSDEKPGLATLAIAEILSMAEQNGNMVAISFYEVNQEHVYDLLDPKQPTVSILEDKGKIQHKGLSQVPVKSVTEFHKLLASMCGSRKSIEKIASELPCRSHRGLIIHLVSPSKNDDICLVGKMNFVDLAGYEDARRKSADGLNLVESTKINRSIYAIHNVVYSLNANESHVPYRQSKLTHMLKDSLGGLNRILMITCLNPSFCQDSVYMVSLASRSCLGINRGAVDSTKKAKCSTRPMVPSSHKKNFLPGSVSTTVKKRTASKVHLSEKKANCLACALKERKLFDEAIHRTTSEKASSLPDIVSTVEPLEQEENFFLASEVSLYGKDHHEQDASYVNGRTNALSFAEGDGMDKENQHFLANEGVSPPISSRLRELSNLKLPCSSTSSYDQVFTEIVEPKAPIMEQSRTLDGMKNSLVQEYLRFLNTADKEDLKRVKGIGEKRATYIVELREESPKPLKSLDDLTKVGLSAKQIKGMMKKEAAKLFN